MLAPSPVYAPVIDEDRPYSLLIDADGAARLGLREGAMLTFDPQQTAPPAPGDVVCVVFKGLRGTHAVGRLSNPQPAAGKARWGEASTPWLDWGNGGRRSYRLQCVARVDRQVHSTSQCPAPELTGAAAVGSCRDKPDAAGVAARST